MTHELNLEFYVRANYVLLHSLWQGGVIALFAILVSQFCGLRVRYWILLGAEWLTFACIVVTFIYLPTHRISPFEKPALDQSRGLSASASFTAIKQETTNDASRATNF